MKLAKQALSWLKKSIAGAVTVLQSGYGGTDSYSGKSVNVQTALQLAAFWACVRLISETIATLPLQLYQRDARGGRTVAREHWLYTVLHDQPNANMTSVEFWEAVVAQLCLWGNAYCFKTYAGARIISLDPLKPNLMQVKTDVNGALTYHYTTAKGVKIYSEAEIWHLKGFGIDGLIGLSPVSYARNSLGASMSSDEASGKVFANGMRSGGALKMAQILKPDQRKEIRESLAPELAGTANTGKLMVLEGGMEYQPLSMNPDDAQMLQTRAFHVEEICFVPGTKILTLDGFKSIELVQVGESVLTHKGRWRAVRHVMRREYSGEVVTVKAKGLSAVTSTLNHPFYAQEVKPDRSNRQVPVGPPQWVDAGELKPSRRNAQGRRGRGAFHALTVPKLAHDLTILCLDMAEWAPSDAPKDSDKVFYSANRRATEVRRFVDLDAEFGWLCGLYASDGSVSDHQVVFYLGAHETVATERLTAALFSVFGVSCTTTNSNSVARTVVSNRILAEFFSDFGRRADLKVLPNFAMASRPEFRRGIVEGLIDGDGCLYGKRAMLRTTSAKLAWQLRLILWSEGLHGSMRTSPAGTWEIEGRQGESKPLHTVEWRPVRQARGSIAQTNDIVYFGLDSTDKAPYSGTVYNLEVEEDESYTTEGGCVHNCRWFRVPPFMVGHSEKSTSWGTGLEQQMLGFLTFALRPYLSRIEQGIKKSLLPPAERAKYHAEFSLEGLMRADSAGRAALYASAAQNGWMTRNEIRELENWPPVDGGDELTVQSNLVPISLLGKITSTATAAKSAVLTWLGLPAIGEEKNES